MNRIHVALPMTSAMIFLAACGGEVGEEDLGRYEDPLVGDTALALVSNTLASDALAPNALAPNALVPNALMSGSLSPSALGDAPLALSALSPASLQALQDPDEAGTLSRQFVQYAVGCAFTSSESFSFSWTDSFNAVHNETYWGILGLAPAWRTQPLAADDQQWVSACLASRVNWYGVSVMLSSRGDSAALDTATTQTELSTYTHEEGAFWGNLFTASPSVYACSYAPNNAHSRWRKRDCAAGHLKSDSSVTECGLIHMVGSCDTHCEPLRSATPFHPSCASDPSNAATATSRVFTIFLK